MDTELRALLAAVIAKADPGITPDEITTIINDIIAALPAILALLSIFIKNPKPAV